ncbi:MAG TPA: MFS transporter [Streptosporangiaceae bacterium]|nr:MFS transporter [Streptosporangiaceae bacterium]
MPRLRGPLASRSFRVLAACNVISLTGSVLSFVAMPFAVLSAGGSAADVGYVAAAQLVPLSVVLLAGGVVADRLPRHRVMAAANAVQAAARGGAAALLLTGQARVWQLIVLTALGGAALGFFLPASQGLLPQTVPADQLAPAYAIDRTGRNAASIGGAALGGLLTGLAGPGWALAIDAASFAVAGLLRVGMHLPGRPAGPATSLWHDLREGWREFTARRWLWATVAQFALVTAAAAATTGVLGPLVANDRLGGARSWGLIVSAYSAGALAGGLVLIRYRPRRQLRAAIGAVPGFSLLLFALAAPLPLGIVLAASAVSGGVLELTEVCWGATLAQQIPPEILSRISSYDQFGGLALSPLGAGVAGPLAAAFGAAAVLVASGALVAALPLLLLATVPEIRRLGGTCPAQPAEPAGARREPPQQPAVSG